MCTPITLNCFVSTLFYVATAAATWTVVSWAVSKALNR